MFLFACLIMMGSAVFDIASLGTIIPSVDRVFSGKPVVLPDSVHSPQWLQDLVDQINQTSPIELLDTLIWVWAILFLGKALFLFLQFYVMADLGQRVVRDVRSDLYAHMTRLSMAFFDRSKVGTLVSRVLNDTGHVQNVVTQGLADLIYQTALLIAYGSSAVFFAYSFGIPLKLILAMAISLPLVVYPVLRLGKRLRKISYQAQVAFADLSSHLMETLAGMTVVKAGNQEGPESDRFRGYNQAHYKIMRSSFRRLGAVAPLSEIVGLVCIIIVMSMGGRRVALGELSLGAFIAFLGALLATIKPFKKLTNVHAVIQQSNAAAQRIFEVIDEPDREDDSKPLPDLPAIKEGIRFEGINFNYQGRNESVLKDINLEVPAGSVVAFVGPSGSGKSTWMSLLLRFYEPSQGRITIDGQDIRDFSRASLRAQIGVVTQEPVLFHDTVRANIAYGAPDASDEAIRRAAEGANATEFIEALPDGFDTVIGDRGHQLSGGQAQRLTIARALVQDPPILILDEATSQLDSGSEQAVQQAIEHLLEDRTVFVVAHRLSTVRKASRIVVLKEGEIVETGRHEELYAQNGLYRRLCEIQFEANQENGN